MVKGWNSVDDPHYVCGNFKCTDDTVGSNIRNSSVIFHVRFVMRLIIDDNGKATDTEGDEHVCVAVG